MRFLSLFSGIEAASVAWRPLGWKAAGVCEIDPFASAVLKHYYPDVPNLGDVEKADFDAIGPVDLVVGGSPCQSFSVAGKRLGMDDPRGNLALVYGQVVYRKRPRWFIFENVPGILSSDSGWDFGTLLASFSGHPPGSVFEPPSRGWRNSGTVREAAKDGYGLAYRVLDAQYVRVDGFGRAVPQRRRRVFVVGHLGDWRRAAAVLFERASLSGHPPPRREAGEATAPTLAARTRGGGGLGTDAELDGALIAFGGNNTSGAIDTAAALNAKGGAGRMDFESETLVLSGADLPLAHSLRGGGFDASEDGTGRGTPLVPVATLPLLEIGKGSTSRGDGPNGAGFGEFGDPMFTLQSGAQHGVAIAFDETQITSKTNRCQPQAGDPSHPLAAGARPPTIAFHARQDPDHGDVAHPLDTDGTSVGIFSRWRVRRLTPMEAERLQGFPDGYTLVPYRGKMAADGPRYRALGNSMAVNCMRWIGRRIDMVEKIKP